MSLSDEFTVWIPQSAEGFGVEPYPYLTRDLIPGVTKYAAGNQLRESNFASNLPELWINPWATNPLPQLEPFATVAMDDDRDFVRKDASRTATDIFSLPPEWPNNN